MNKLLSLVELARPKHWIKNAFVFMPIPFSLAAGGSLDPWVFALGLFAFSLANSGVYALNDAQDAEQDKNHPKKQKRPVASGRVGVTEARVFSVFLFVVSIGLMWLTGSTSAVLITVLYIVLNLIYSFGAKNVPLLDVFLLSSGFVLRVLLGTALIDVVPSSWLLLCSYTLALFLALAKRRADLAKGLGSEHRPSLAGYSMRFLDQAMGITAAMTLMAYAMYSMEAEVLIPGREFASLPFVVFGVLDYLRVALVKEGGGSPVDLILSSPALLISGLGWVVATTWSVGLQVP